MLDRLLVQIGVAGRVSAQRGVGQLGDDLAAHLGTVVGHSGNSLCSDRPVSDGPDNKIVSAYGVARGSLAQRFAGLGATIDDQSDRLDPILLDRVWWPGPPPRQVMTRYLARVHHDGSISIHRNDQPEPVAAVILPPDGTSLRRALREAGWRPTGRPAPGRGWAAIYVERLPSSHEFRRPGT